VTPELWVLSMVLVSRHLLWH